MHKIVTRNPYTDQAIKEYEPLTAKEIINHIEIAGKEFHKWRKTSFDARKKLFLALAQDLENNSEEYATLMVEEMGKPINQAVAEVEKCAWVCNYYAENAESFLANKVIETDASKSYVSYEPLGVILAIMPWNYPLWQLMRFAAPTLMAGNVALLKHASSVSGYSQLINKIFEKNGFPQGVFQSLIIHSDQVESVIRNPIIKAISLTGSGKAGAIVASTAASEIKKSVLELGGNNATIILDDADLENHLKTIAWARFQNTGQSCIAAKRFLVHEKIYDDFKTKFKKEVESYIVGDPMDYQTEIGPMSSAELAEELKKQVDKSVEMGAEVLLGGNHQKAHFEPTILTGMTPGMPAYEEELFGPVASIMKVKNLDEAIFHSNASDFGLGVSIYGQNVGRIIDRIPDFYEGAVFINDLVKSDPRLPFGGVQNSGFGRELSHDGILEFVNKKTVYIN